MSGFDTFIIVDWSAASSLSPRTPSRDAIWIGVARGDAKVETRYCRGRVEAERQISGLIEQEQAADRRTLIGFDFPFGYPAGYARRITGSDDPFALWDWLAERIRDDASNRNNRFDVAEEMNRQFEGPGPLWGKSHRDRWPDLPYRKEGIVFDAVRERRHCDEQAGAASSCFQLFFNPTVGSQVLMGLPMLSRLRRMCGVVVWPFEPLDDARTVLAEVWPGLIEPAVGAAMTPDGIRDEVQVRLLARALARLSPGVASEWMNDLPCAAREEGWILGAGYKDDLVASLSQEGATPVPPLNNDCFALPQGVDWTPIPEALDHLRRRLAPVSAICNVPILEADGRIVARDVIARRSNPPLPNTAVDGYGFAGGRGDGTHSLPLADGRAAAGDAPGHVPEGHAIRILTGAALPQGVDTVVLQESVIVSNAVVSFRGPIRPGANTRAAGEDVKAGGLVLPRGRRIGPAEIALLSATGVARLAVHAPLRVAVVSTGAELVEPGATAADGQIFDANRPMLIEMIKRFGHHPVDMGIVPDDRAVLAQAFDRAAREADVIVTSGGASAGDEDHVSALLEQAGNMTLWRIAVKPGRPLALGMWSGAPVFGLPGNPVAAMVCALIFARPALALLAGAEWSEPQGFEVPAAFSKSKKHGRAEFLRARIRDGRAEVFASEGSGRISGLSWAEGLVELPFEAVTIVPGTSVRYIPFSSFGI